MSTHTFTWGEDQHGNNGWVLNGYDNFDVTDPRLMAHDCLEHLPRGQKHGAAADELLALGARFYLRVSSGWWWSQRTLGMVSVPDAWGRELERIHRDDHGDLPTCKLIPLDDEDMECEMQACLAAAVKEINSPQEEDEEPYVTLESDFIVQAGAWLRAGYRAAIKRYKGTDPLNIMWLAECLEKEAASYTRGEEGDRLVITVHEKDQTATVTYKPHEWTNNDN